ncbi:MAG: NUDIX hydrolase [Chloroflexi bacterium]|nr:NUDIX hydrolase [Chloroflexota bacterium]
MKPGKIRPLAICVFSREGRILAAEGYDAVKQEVFYRPLGGRIEFGETGAQTVARELDEEIHAAVANLRYLGTLENIFTYNGQPGHEIVLVYDGDLVDPALYQREAIEGREDDDRLLFVARWKALDEFRGEGAPPLYPHGLLALLDAHNI